MSGSPILYSDIFDVKVVDPDGKTFDKVTRFSAASLTTGIEMLIDINTDVYQLRKGDRFSLVLASSLYKDNRPDPGVYTDYSKESTLMDDFDYCMYGKVFKYQYESDNRVLMYVSYGGLLMSLNGNRSQLENVKYGDHLYCLIKKNEMK